MKKLLALILALTLVFALSACKEENTPTAEYEKVLEAKELSAEKILSKATEVTEEITSVSMKMDMDMSMSANGEAVDINMVADMDCDLENGLAYMKTAMEGQDMEIEAYVEYNGDMATMYMNMMGTWMKQEVSVANMGELGMGMSYDIKSDLVNYLESFENCTVEEDGDEYKIVGNLGDVMTEEITSSVMENIGAAEIPEESLETLLDCFKNVEYVMYIDSETFYPTRIEMDLSAAMREFMESLAKEMGQEIAFDEMDIKANVEYFDYNEDLNIVIPEEAKAAESVQALVA